MSLDPLEIAERDRALADAEAAARVPAARPRGREGEPFATLDASGLPPMKELAQIESNVFRRLSPRRSRWPEVAALDERVADLERLLAEARERLRALREKHANEPTLHAGELATWLGDQKGPRPQSSRPAIEEQISEVEAEAAGLEILVDRALADKDLFVTKNRKRLVRSAAAHTGEAHKRVLELVDQLEDARQMLVEAREAAVWSALYPAESASRGPQSSLLAAGMARPVRATLGLETAVEYGRVLAALRADALYWLDAATPAQRAEMTGTTDSARARGAAWTGTQAGVEFEREEKQAARERYVALWGEEPGPS